jgi:hypothetical protein
MFTLCSSVTRSETSDKKKKETASGWCPWQALGCWQRWDRLVGPQGEAQNLPEEMGRAVRT